jgi:ABC-type dipeptide/oligopeptide/nickel transport system permease component
MARYLLKRLVHTLPVLWLVFTLVFLMIHIVPGDPSSKCLEKAPLRVK